MPHKKIAAVLILCAILIIVDGSLWAVPDPFAHTPAGIPENLYLRTLLIDQVLEEPIETARKLPATMDKDAEPGYGIPVQFFVEEQNDSVYFCFYHGDDVEFSDAVAGSYIIKRSRQEGTLEQIKIFYKSEPGSFVRIFPDREGLSRIDVYLRDRKIQSDVKIHLPLEKIARMPFSELVRRTIAYIDWEFYIPMGEFLPPELTTVDDLYQQVKPYLEQLRDAEDGAINSKGEFVYIRDGSAQSGEGGLNCSGFAKWVVDSLLYPHTDRLLSIDTLKRPHPEYRGNRWSSKVEEIEDPYFGLDWSRNLAIEAHKALDVLPGEATGAAPGNAINPEFADVDFLRYHKYVGDVGYPVKQIETLMYELAKENPGHIYLGSVNTMVHSEYELRKHLHVAVFFPWLDAQGRLVLKILDTNEETSIAAFIRRYGEDYVHLVSIPHIGVFKPANMRLEPVLKR